MSDNFNVVTLVGRIGQDPDLKTFESGAFLTKTSLAVNRKKGEEPDWFSLELWNKQAEVMANFCQKGSLISVQGELKLDEWVAQDGTPRSKVVIKVNKLELLATGNNNQAPIPTSENYNSSDLTKFWYILDPETETSYPLATVNKQGGQLPVGTKVKGQITGGVTATATLNLPNLTKPITFGKVNEGEFSDRSFFNAPIRAKLNLSVCYTTSKMAIAVGRKLVRGDLLTITRTRGDRYLLPMTFFHTALILFTTLFCKSSSNNGSI